MVALNLSRELRIALRPVVKFRQFAQIKDATQQGLHRGATFHWNVFSKLSTGGTTIAETATMPESQFTITQGTLTVTEYGNSVPYTGKLDNLSEQPVREIVHSVLRIDAQETLDTAAAQRNIDLSDHADHQRNGDRDQQRRARQGACEADRRSAKRAQHPGLRGRR
jgi:hypothetical protein